MKNKLLFKQTKLLFLLAFALFSSMGWGQTIAPGGTYTQNFNTIGTTTATLPTGWKIENITGARTINAAYSSVTNTANLALAYNAAMSGTATNGKYNFGGGVSTGDQAIGGVSSGSASQSINMFLQLTNSSSTTSINSFTISYDAERYRNGSNAAGASIRLYYSTTGLVNSWTEIAGGILSFSPNVNNLGSTTNPLETKSVSSFALAQSLAASGSIYFAWNYSVTSGTTTSNIQALGIDNISITAISTSTDATLSALALSEGTLDPTFAAATTTYAASVANATSTISVTPTRNQANATIEARVNGATYTAVTSGNASGDLDLNVGDNTVEVKVTAQDGTTTKTYTTTVTRVSTDATLSALTISTGTLAPTFTALGNTYFASTSNATSTITVTPTRNQANATIGVSVNGGTFTAVSSGSASGALSLDVGTNTIEVKVTAQDGITTETYSISVTRPGITTWDGTSWSNGLPTQGFNTTLEVIINGNFLTTDTGDTAGFTAERLTVNSGKLFTIATGHNVTVNNGIINNGTFTVKNNANLIQNNEVEANTGNIIVERESASIRLYDYTLWSSPVAGQKLKAFSPQTLDTRFYSYNSTTNFYNVVAAPATTNFAPATGYLIRTPNNWTANTPQTFTGHFEGVPNNGTVSFTGLISGKFYAVGNPYPSNISAFAFLGNNFESISTLYFWRRTNGDTNTTAYATQTLFAETAAGGLTPNSNIAVGQGFIIDVIPNATGTVTFDNSNRFGINNSPEFLRTTVEKHRLWLNLTNTSGLFSQMVVGYGSNATMGVDNGIDGRYLNDAPTALTSLINAEEYTIQGRPLPFTTTDTVPLGFKTSVAGNYNITIDHVDGLFSAGQTVYLKDNLLNTVVNLSAGSYSFASAVGTFNSRFEVVYQSTLSITNPTFTANSVIVFSENGEIKINSGSTIMELVRVYDLQGRLLVEKKQINASETKIQTAAANQVLLVEITAANGSKITKKIIQ